MSQSKTVGDVVRVTGSDAVPDGVYTVATVKGNLVWVTRPTVTRTRVLVDLIPVDVKCCETLDDVLG